MQTSKSPALRDGTTLSKKQTLSNSTINSDHGGAREKIPTENEILEGYEIVRQFFLDREKYHQEAAKWYFNHACEMEAKAVKHLDKAERAYQQASHYLDLLVMATLKRIDRNQEVKNAA